MAPKMKIRGILICLLIVALDISAGILGIKAEIAQKKAKHLKVWIFECKRTSHDAFKFGIIAAALVSIAHVVLNLLGGCLCMCSQDELRKFASKRKLLSLAFLVLSWAIVAAGLAALVIGTLSNKKSRVSCGFSYQHFFFIGGILCFVHGLFSVAYFVFGGRCHS